MLEPSRQLSPVEALFLMYINGKNADLSYLPKYWDNQYKLNVSALIEKLERLGYIRRVGGELALENSTLSEIKSFLQAKGLPAKGKKANLINLLVSNVSEHEYSKVFTRMYFVATENAHSELNRGEFLSYFHNKDLGISIEEADNRAKECGSYNILEVTIPVFKKRAAEHLSKEAYSIY